MYALCYELRSFGMLDVQTQLAVLQHFVDGLTLANIGYLQRVAAPMLYESGVYYKPDSDRIERQWWDVPATLEHGFGDCKALAAWRAAELRVQGERADTRVVLDSIDKKVTNFHVYVTRYRGTEDPSEILGMR
jgi:hypothetical protein